MGTGCRHLRLGRGDGRQARCRTVQPTAVNRRRYAPPHLRSVPRPAAPAEYRAVARRQEPVSRRVLSRGLHLRKAGADLRGRGRQGHAACDLCGPVRLLRHGPQAAAAEAGARGLSSPPAAEPARQIRRSGRLPGRELLPRDRAGAGLWQLGARACHRHGHRRQARGIPALPRLLAAETRGQRERHDSVGPARLAGCRWRLFLHHPARRAHGDRHQVHRLHAQRRRGARHRAAHLDVLLRQGFAHARRLPARDPRCGRAVPFDRQGRADLAPAGKSRGAGRLLVPGPQPARFRPLAARARLRPLSGQRRQARGAARPVGRAGGRLG